MERSLALKILGTQKGRIKGRFLEPKFDRKRKKKKTALYSTFFVWKISQWESKNNALFRGEKASKKFSGASRRVNSSVLKNKKIGKIHFKRKEKKKTALYSTFLGIGTLGFCLIPGRQIYVKIWNEKSK